MKFSKADVYRCDVYRAQGLSLRAIAAQFTKLGTPASEYKIRAALSRKGAYASVPPYNLEHNRAVVARAWQRALDARKEDNNA